MFFQQFHLQRLNVWHITLEDRINIDFNYSHQNKQSIIINKTFLNLYLKLSKICLISIVKYSKA